jgi:hypothetical protein
MCIKLVIETSLYYDAGSEKHQIIFIRLLISLTHNGMLHVQITITNLSKPYAQQTSP